MRTSTALGLLSLATAVGLLACANSPGFAHGGHTPSAPPAGPAPSAGKAPAKQLRYRLANYWKGHEVRVLDTRTGRLFCLNEERGEALCVDPLAGTSVSKPIERATVAKPAVAATWPARDAAPGGDFGVVGESDTRAGSIEAGATPILFDPHTGRLIKILSPLETLVVDPVEGKLTRRQLRLSDGTKLAARMIKTRNEYQTELGLRTLVLAQRQLRDLDLDRDGKNEYGTLKALGQAKLIKAALAKGSLPGYRVELDLDRRGNLWLAIASPTTPGQTGDRHFVINHRGLLYERATPIQLNPDFEIPLDAKRVDPRR